MARTIATDALDPEETGASDWAARLLAARSAPSWTLAGPAAVVLSELPDTALGLVDPYGMFGRVVRLTGAPARLGTYHRVRSAELTLAGKDSALLLGLEPAAYSAPPSVSAASLSETATGVQIKFRHMTGITANDLKGTSND
jgi:hypothetical protein